MAMEEEEEEELKRGGVRAPSSPSRKAAAEVVHPPPPPPHHPKLLKKFLLSFCCCFMENKEEGGTGFIYFSNPNPNPNPNPDPNPGGADSMETLPPPRWKQILRRLKAERHRLNGSRRRQPLFLYDPLSYSMNFDDSCRWQQLDDMQSFRLSSTALTA